MSCDSAGVVQIWNIPTGEEIFRCDGPIGTAFNIFQWSPDGKQFAIQNAWNEIVIYNSSSHKK